MDIILVLYHVTPNGHQPLWTSIVLGTCEPHSHSLVWWLQLHHIVSTVPLLDHQTWLVQVPLSCTWRIHYMKKRKQKKNVFHVTESLEVGNAFLKTKGLMFFNAVFLSLRSWTAVLGVESKCHFSVSLLCRNRHFWKEMGWGQSKPPLAQGHVTSFTGAQSKGGMRIFIFH